MKNIVLCSDGTGNAGGKGYTTNVWHLFQSLDLNGHLWDPTLCEQLAYHDDGVGTRDNPIHRFWGQATGWGLSQNIRELYLFLVNNYEAGDRIYIFGFSRGAYTARSLAGVIAMCGVIDRRRYEVDELERLSKQAIRILRSAFIRGVTEWMQSEDAHKKHERSLRESTRQFRLQHAVPIEGSDSCQTPIEFVGVWDTVDAYGFPSDMVADWVHFLIYAYKFPDTKLSRLVRNGRQAIALDDERRTFHPVLWDADPNQPERIKQVWFAGVHANVGGGYPKQGLAMISLDWMMSEAEAVRDATPGLRFISDAREAVRKSANPYDKLYNSRTGFALAYGYTPRDIAALAKAHGIGKPAIHESVIRRIRSGTEGYAPLGLPCDFDIALTRGTHADADALEETRQQIRAALRGHSSGGRENEPPLAAGLNVWIRLRRTTNWVVLWAAFAFLVAPWVGAVIRSDADFAKAIWQLPQWTGATADWERLAPGVVVLALLVWQLTAYAKRRIRDATNRFWRNLFRRL
jgi:uncharacterized protein (DUF2235 family)